MYTVEGMKLKGNTFKWTYTDINVAQFEYNVTQLVSLYVVLAEENEGLYNQLDVYYKK